MLHVHAHHVVKELAVHEARADHIHCPVDVRLVPISVVREDLAHTPEQHRLKLPQHRAVGQCDAECAAALQHKRAALAQRERASSAARSCAFRCREHATAPQARAQRDHRRCLHTHQAYLAAVRRRLHVPRVQLHQQRRKQRTRKQLPQRRRRPLVVLRRPRSIRLVDQP